MFWENLTEKEAKRYAALLHITRAWVAWITTEEKDRTGPEPPRPSDEDWIEFEVLAMKGWNVKVVRACPGQYSLAEAQSLQEASSSPQR